MTVDPSSAEVRSLALPADDDQPAPKVAPPPTLFDAAPAMLAADLTHETMPAWLFAAGRADKRWARGPAAQPYSWHIYAGAALDYSGLPLAPRAILFRILDRHTGDDRDVTMSATQIARRAGLAARETVQRAYPGLVAGGWLLVAPNRGDGPTLTLMCPLDRPVNKVGHAEMTCDPQSHPPVTDDHTHLWPTVTPPVTDDHTHQGKGLLGHTGHTRSSRRDAIGQRPVDTAPTVRLIDTSPAAIAHRARTATR